MERIENLLSRKKMFFLTGITVLSSVLRFYHINYQSLWLDELYSTIPTAPGLSLSSIIEYCKGDQPPFFFVYVHYVFKLTAYNELTGRIACAVLGVLGVLAIFFLGKECKGNTVGLFAAFLTGINYFHIYYSQELRFYSMAFLFATLSFLFFIKAIKKSRAIDFLGYILCATCLLYTQYFGLIIFGTQALSFLFLVIYKRDLKFILLSLLSAVIIIIAFIPWMPVVMSDIGVDLGWIKRPEPHFVAQYFYDYTGKDIVTTLVFLAFFYFFSQPLFKGLLDKETRMVYIVLIFWIVMSYLVPYLRSILVSPMLNVRYTIVTLPAWIMIFAIGWDRIKNVKWKYSLPLVLLLSFTFNMIFYKKHYTRIQKSQFREASEVVLTENKLNYPVYSGLSWHYNFYFRKNAEKVLDVNTVDLSGVEHFWLLQAHYSSEEMEAEVEKLSTNFKVIERHPFYEANALLMERSTDH